MQKNKRTMMIVFVLGLSGLLGLTFSLYMHGKFNSRVHAARLQVFHYPATLVKQLENDPNAGEKIFKEYCTSCHGKKPIIPILAPLIGDKKEWKKLSRLGLPALLKTTIDGKDAMPARGGCFECSDKQIRQAIEYILNQS